MCSRKSALNMLPTFACCAEMRTLFSFSREKVSFLVKGPLLYFMTLMPEFIFRRWVRRYEGVVLIYQMGKVASSSIYASLRKDPRLLVLHFHRMPGENRVAINRRMGMKFRLRSSLHDLQGTIGYRLMCRCPQNTFLITLVRDPFSRNISGYFQNLWLHRIDGGAAADQDAIDKVLNLLGSDYDHEVPLRWFDDEFKPATGIDVFSIPFAASAKAGIYRNTIYPLLILRTDLEDDLKIAFLRDFLSRPGLRLQRSNSGEEKSYSELYRAVRSKYRYPPEYVGRALKSKLMLHFFSAEERLELGARHQMTQEQATNVE